MMLKRGLAILLGLTILAALPLRAPAEGAQGAGTAWRNILLLGGDSHEAQEYGETDSIIIVSLNFESNRVKFTSVMRDTYAAIPGMTGMRRLNEACLYGGPELAVASVSECFGVDIDRYMFINLAGLVRMIDLLGGVDLEVSEAEREWINVYAQDFAQQIGGYDGQTQLEEAGWAHLNGLLALSYTRDRYSDSDYGRVMRQQEMLLALAQRVQEADLRALLAGAAALAECVSTNLTGEELREIAALGLLTDLEEVERLRVPADGTFNTAMADDNWVIEPDLDSNRRLLREFIYGEE